MRGSGPIHSDKAISDVLWRPVRTCVAVLAAAGLEARAGEEAEDVDLGAGAAAGGGRRGGVARRLVAQVALDVACAGVGVVGALIRCVTALSPRPRGGIVGCGAEVERDGHTLADPDLRLQ